MTRRRDFLAFTAGAAASGVALPIAIAHAADNPDAELIALCGQFDALEQQALALYDGPTRIKDEDECDALHDAITDQQRPLLARLCEMRATTEAGFRARAATANLWWNVKPEPDEAYWDERMIMALLRDLTGKA